jgi:DNA-binding CsgD family transcriptional regulator
VKADAISIVEAAYDCEGDERTWFRRLVEHAAPKFDRGFGVSIARYAPGIGPEEALIWSCGMKGAFIEATNAMVSANPEPYHRLLSTESGVLNSVSQFLGGKAEDAGDWAAFGEYMHPIGVRDIAGMVARDPTGHVICLSVPAPDLVCTTPRDVATWSRIATHITAGARLRRGLSAASSDDLSEGADAVLSPSGAVSHAAVAAQSSSARESLRRAAKAIVRARRKARSNEDEALDLWQGLVAGRWSLLDRFDTDGRRFLVARKNDPDVTDPRALTLRERQVLAYSAMGHPLKLIAYALGITTSTIAASRKLAIRKLGLRTHADVVRLFAAAPGPEPLAQDR